MTQEKNPVNITVREPAGLSVAYTTAALRPQDISALCSFLELPLPTPDVPLDRILEDAGLTLADAWKATQGTTDIRVMIAAAALRGAITVCPKDPRLDPLPHRKAPVRTPTTDEERERSPAAPAAATRAASASGDRVLEYVSANPKKPGSAAHERFALYKVGMTADELVASGVRKADLRWDAERGFVRWSEPAAATASGDGSAEEDAS